MNSHVLAAPEEGATAMTPADDDEPAPPAPPPPAAPDADPITQNLRTLFDSVQNEALPDKLQQLLDKLGQEEEDRK